MNICRNIAGTFCYEKRQKNKLSFGSDNYG